MTEKEAVERLKNRIIQSKITFNVQTFASKDIEAIQGLLDLYNKEKEERKKAEHNYDELTKTTGKPEIELNEEKIEKPDWQKLCDECSNIAKQAGITKEDTDRMLKETREMQWKAKKYDEVLEKLEADKMEQFVIT